MIAQAKRWQARLSSRTSYGVLLLAFILAAFLRFWEIGSRPGYDWDEPVYANLVGNIAQHHTLVIKAQYGTKAQPWLFHPPFHFLLVGQWFKLAGTGIVQARVWGASMSLVAMVLLFFALKAMVGSKQAFRTTALLSIDAWMVYANRVSSIENTLLVFIVLAIWFYWRAMQQPTATRFVVAGMLVGAVTLYKFTGAYILIAVLINWFIQRQRRLNRQHLLLVATTFAVVVLYCIAMTFFFWKSGNDFFWKDNADQLQRTLALHGSRGKASNTLAMVTPLVHQYRVFVGTILVAVSSTVLVAVRLIQCFRARSWERVKKNSVLFSWVLASILSFGSIGLKFPTYFQLLLVPMYVYLVVELGEIIGRRNSTKDQQRRWLVNVGAAVLVLLSLLGFKWRIVDHHDNAIKQTQHYAETQIPANAVILAEEAIGTIVPQQYCNIYRAEACQNVVSYIITYKTDQHPIPSNPAFSRLLGHSTEVQVYTGFKETITIWRVNR